LLGHRKTLFNDWTVRAMRMNRSSLRCGTYGDAFKHGRPRSAWLRSYSDKKSLQGGACRLGQRRTVVVAVSG